MLYHASNHVEARRAWSLLAMVVTSLMLWAAIIEAARAFF